MDLEDVVPPLAGLPPAAAAAVAAQPLLPVAVSGDRQYVLSLRYGHVLDGPGLRALLDGSLLLENGEPVAAAAGETLRRGGGG